MKRIHTGNPSDLVCVHTCRWTRTSHAFPVDDWPAPLVGAAAHRSDTPGAWPRTRAAAPPAGSQPASSQPLLLPALAPPLTHLQGYLETIEMVVASLIDRDSYFVCGSTVGPNLEEERNKCDGTINASKQKCHTVP
jgi:hypothetical protein